MQFLIFCTLLLLTFWNSLNAANINPGHIKVVVVGAGAAGLSVAQKLIEKGFDVTVLEASNVVGGRIQSVYLNDTSDGWLEMGPQYVYGFGEFKDFIKTNEYVEKVEQNDVSLSDVRGQLEKKDESALQILDGVFMELVALMEDNNLPTEERKMHSAGEYLDTRYKEHLLRTGELPKKEKELAEAAYDINIRGHKTTLGVDSLYDVGIDTYNTLQMSSMELHRLNVPFFQVFEHLVMGVKEENIQLNKVVTSIHFDKKTKSDYPVTVTTADGSKERAHHVIFTASLGVLKAQHETLFKPKLSQQRQKDIERVGFGQVEKIFAIFKKSYWQEVFGEKVDGFNLYWETDSERNADGLRRYGDKPWYRSIEGISVAAAAPNVLEIVVTGHFAEIVAKLSDAELSYDITKLLREFTKNEDIPMPTKIIKTSWSTNPFYKGSKSYVSYQGVEKDVTFRNLSKPTWNYDHEGIKVPALLFAGEGTHSKFFSTVQGAIESGYREAKRLVKLYGL